VASRGALTAVRYLPTQGIVTNGNVYTSTERTRCSSTARHARPAGQDNFQGLPRSRQCTNQSSKVRRQNRAIFEIARCVRDPKPWIGAIVM